MNFSSWNKKGIALAQKGKFKEARLCFQGAIDCDPDNAAAWNNLGNTYLHNEEWNEALDFFIKSIECDTEFVEPYLSGGVCLSNMGIPQQAIELYNFGLHSIPDDSGIWYNKGYTLAEMNRIPEAIAVYDHVLELKQHDQPTILNRNHLLEKCTFQSTCTYYRVEDTEVVPLRGEIYSWNGVFFMTPLFDEPEEEFQESYDPDKVGIYQNFPGIIDEIPEYKIDIERKKEDDSESNPRFTWKWKVISYPESDSYRVRSELYDTNNPAWAETPDYSNPIIHPFAPEPMYLEDVSLIDQDTFVVKTISGHVYVIDWDEDMVVAIKPDTLQYWNLECFLGKKLKKSDILALDLYECAWLYWSYWEERKGPFSRHFSE